MKRALVLVILLVGCSDILTPSRTPRYLPTDPDGNVFRWPSDRLPVRYFADTRGNMAELVGSGLQAWERQFLYGEFTATLVTDSSQADVIVIWEDSVPPDVPPDTAGALGACSGFTRFLFDSTGALSAPPSPSPMAGIDPPFTMTEPMHVFLRVFSGHAEAQVAACMHRVSAHELGHTLGILTHSPANADLMWGTPTTDTPTNRDRNTAQVLYHTAPTIAPPPR